MALKDCINKIGVVSKEDKAKLEDYIGQGMNDAQAVRRLLIESSANVVEIATQAREAGAEVADAPDTIGEIRDLTDQRIQKLSDQRNELADQIEESNSEYGELAGDAQVFDGVFKSRSGSAQSLDELSEAEAIMRLGQAMFESSFREGVQKGVMGIQGNTPAQVWASWEAARERREANRKQHREIIQKYNDVKNKLNEILQGKPPPREFFQSDIDAKVTVNQGRVIKLLGPALYGDMGQVAAVTLKELFQNAFDATRSAVDKGAIDEGLINIDVTDDMRTITITDNGVGMTPEMIQGGFLRVAGTMKEGDTNSGGFGIAKMLFLAGNKNLQLITVRDGVKSTMELTGEQYIANADDPAKTPIRIRTEETTEPNGTVVEVTIPDTYVDFRTGETREVSALSGYNITANVEGQLLHPKITVSRSDRSYNVFSGASFRYDDYNKIGTIEFEWGEAEVLIGKAEREYTYGENTTISVNGLKQFGLNITENPMAMQADNIPREMHVNIKPKMKPEEPGYPFNLQRQGFRDFAESDFLQLQAYIATLYARDKTAELAQGYGLLRTLEKDGTTSGEIDLTPDKKVEGLKFKIDTGDKVEVREGQLVVDGKKQEKLDKEQMGQERIEVEEYRIDQGLVPTKRPLIHNQKRFKVDAGELTNVNKPYAGMDLMEALYQDYGEAEVNNYLNTVGEAFMVLRDLMAVKGGRRYEGVGKAGAGVSVLGETYYGVHVRVPATMMFVNPFADPKESQVRYDEMSEAERRDIIASSMMTTMIHEIAHYSEMNHGVNYIFALQDAFATVLRDTKLAEGIRQSITDALAEIPDAYQFVQDALESADLEDIGISLLDVGSQSARNDSGIGDTVGERETEPGRSGTPGEPAEGTAAREQRDVDERIQAGARPSGIVVPPGSVNPLAGSDAGIFDMEFEQSKRGSITFNEMKQATINLFDAADFSTFIHESGHLYLELMNMLQARPDASETILRDWQTILDYLGVESADQIGTEQHELWARTFEKYAMDGKAPTTALQDAFNAFRRWLLEIYKTVLGVRDIEIPDDIRDVMDRMLATEAEILRAEDQQEMAPLFSTAEDMGVSQEVFEVYKRGLMRAHGEAVERETTRLLKEMNRDEREWYKNERSKIEAGVRAEAEDMKEYRAIYMLTRGTLPNGEPTAMAPFKLDRAALVERYGEDFVKRLPHKGKYGVYRREGGVDPDVAAQALGFVDGDALMQVLLRTPNMEDWIKAETEMRMRQQFPDPFKDGSIADNAVRAVHNNKRAEILAAEMRQLRALQRKDRPIVRATERAQARETREAREANRGILPKRAELAVIKESAKQAIGRKAIRDVRPNVYLNAERKSGRLAFEAAARGDYQAAFKHKREQLINHEYYRAAIRAKERAGTTQKYLSKFEKRKVQQRLGRSGVLDKILAVLEGIDFRRRSLKAIDRQKIEQELAKAIDEGEIVMPPGVLDRVFDGRVNWQELTVDEFEAMRDLVKQLEKQARAEVEAIVNGEKVDIDNAANEVAEQIYGQNKIVDMGVGNDTKWQQARKNLRTGVAAWLRPSSIARVLDNAGFGAITRLVIVPMRRAYSERLIPELHRAQSEVSKIYRKHFDNEQLRLLNRKRFRIDAQNETYSHADLLSLALNWGNQSSRDAVRNGKKRDGTAAFSEAGINQMLANLTENDWAFVQEVWDYLDTYWPDLSAAEQRRRGIAPAKVDPLAFTIRTADGNEVALRGGYYPLKYASEHSDRVKVDEMEDYMKQMGNGVFVSASTRAGATYDRTRNHGRVVRLSLNVLDNHLREIVRDIAIGDEVNYLRRLLAKKELRDAFYRTDNGELLTALNLWLTDAAVGELPSEGIVESTTSWIRTGFTKAKLGWNMMTVMLQFTGVFQTIAVVGSKQYAIGFGKFLRDPAGMWRDVMERSKFLNTRYDVGAWDKDVQDTKAHLESFFGPAPTRLKVSMNFLAHTYFLPIAKAQQVVDITTWLAAYDKGRSEMNLPENEAIIYADTQVEAAQTSGFFSDRSGLERGTLGMRKNRQSQFIRIWTTLISYMLAKGNIAYEKTKATQWRKASSVAEWATDMVFLFTVEGIASALLYGQLPEDDEAEDWAAWVATRTADSVVAGIPFIREIPSSRFAGGNTPLGSFAKDLYDLSVQIQQGENDEAARRALYNVVGTAFHLPEAQLGRTFETIWAEDDADWYEYITGVRDD